MRKLFLSTVAAAAVLSSGAFAADLPVRGPAIAPAPVFVAMNWSGFYIGAHAGYGWGDSKWHFIQANTRTNPKPDGAFGGAQIGYNYQMGSLVLGVEADGSLAALSSSVACPNPAFNCGTKAEWLATVRLRAGVTFDRALLYVTGGAEFGELKHRSVAVGGPVFGTTSHTAGGFAVGAGVEYAFSNNWSAKVEYMYYDLGKHTVAAGVLGASNTRISTDIHTVKVGLNYRFGGPAGAVVAKY